MEEGMDSPSTKDKRPDRKKLGPTGPAKTHHDSDVTYDEKHPNPGTVGTDKPVGPPSTPKDGTTDGAE